MSKKILPLFVLFVFAIFLILPSHVLAAPFSIPIHEGQILVKFKDTTSQSVINSELKKQNGKVVDQINTLNTLVLQVPDVVKDAVIQALSKNPFVEYAEINATA